MNTEPLEVIESDNDIRGDGQERVEASIQNEASTQDNAETEQEQPPCIGPGICLCKVREEQGFNRAKVGQQLGLTETAVKDLERNLFDRFPSSVYVRGYLKNYAKILGESEREIIEIYDRYCQENNLDSGKSTMEPLQERTGPGNLVKILFGFVIISVAVVLYSFLGRS